MALTITAANGRLPAAMLVVVEDGAGPRGPQRLRVDAAASWEQMRAAGMPGGCLRSGYRDRAEQAAEVERAKRGETPSAAPVGRSYHGEGTAADVDEPARSWIRKHGRAFGWVAGTVAGEPWHMVYDHELNEHREEEDMPTAQEIAAAVWAYPSPTRPGVPMAREVADTKTKAERQDPALIHFQLADGRWCVAVPRTQSWAVAPSDETWRKHRDVLHLIGWLDTPAVRTWSQLTGGTSDVVQNPLALGREVPWSRLL